MGLRTRGVVAVWLLALLALVPQQRASAQPVGCSSSLQQVQCGQLPLETEDQQAAYVSCCTRFAPAPRSVRSEDDVLAASVPPPPPPRPDLNVSGRLRVAPPYPAAYGTCLPRLRIAVPTFPAGQPPRMVTQLAPGLSRDVIGRIKAHALARLRGNDTRIRSLHDSLRSVNAVSGFVHPAAMAGPAELAVLAVRVPAGAQPATLALDQLLTGNGMPPKVYRGGWFPATDTPLEYAGPYPLGVMATKYGGAAADTSACPPNYPPAAPRDICGHVSFVELDAAMAARQAAAYRATGEVRHAANALRILRAWATTNTAWGLVRENGPLEAAWGLAAMSRALEMLRGVDGFDETYAAYTAWVEAVVMPGMDEFVDVISARAIERGTPNIYGNWHATLAEAFVAHGLLTDSRARYEKGLSLFRATLADYLRWGRAGSPSADGRLPGECSETLRDIYHSLFGLGSLLQTAELAWQQDDDVYSSSGHALVAALELHARIINAWDAGRNESLLPPGFKWYDTSMPRPAPGTEWRFNIQTQLWFALNRTTFAPVPNSNLTDGVKYVLGVKFLPTGWEAAYNHYVGRLGLRMPESASLLSRYAPEWQEFCWGLGTISHADTASLLWRRGVQLSTMCG